MDVEKIFGRHVFSEREQKKRLPPDVYKNLKRTRERGLELSPDAACVIAKAMMEWAMEQGATHYTHWFQPMTNITAGKCDAFAEYDGHGGIINAFSAAALIKGEPDASSFPSGGLRATFEARGYTAWDPTSPAFVKDNALYIPTAFCAYTGEALDQKTPLLRAMQALSKEALRLLRLLGDTDVHAVTPTVGLEQEYFLIDREQYERRIDLKICGRTLVGARPPKGQELDDHYCGRIRLRVAAFMKDLDRELWSYGVLSKTKHNESAPAQHEFACMYNTANIACDHNQLAMELARLVAKKHHLACLLHEKPFAGVNGSGKHNNFSLETSDGRNLLSPGKNPMHKQAFLLILAAFVRSVDKYADLLRLAASCPGNDRRLGGNEAPPAIISIFLGGALTDLLEHVAEDGYGKTPEDLATGVTALPILHKDDSDRNRTSPLAFTGTKFEFRMLGSSQSAALANTVLCTILADSLYGFCNRLEMAADPHTESRDIVRDTMRDHGRVIFNGNNYAPAWRSEAKRRGLANISSTLDAIPAITAHKNVELFERFGVFSEAECGARQEIMLDNYIKVLSIEASTMIALVSRRLYPAALRCAGAMAAACTELDRAHAPSRTGRETLRNLTREMDGMGDALTVLQGVYGALSTLEEAHRQTLLIRDELIPAMTRLRGHCDAFESMSDKEYYPIPDYVDLIHRV